jgi:transcriptional regulator of acetoin/glycerol metabolism
MSEIARRLGIGRSTLYRKLREYGLDERVAV